MIRRHAIGIAAIAGCLLGLCGTGMGAEEPATQVLVKIDDFAITTLHLGLFASQTGRNPQQADEQIRMLNELANNFLVANSKQGKALEKTPEIVAALDVARARLIAQAYVLNEIDAMVIDESSVRERYQTLYGGEPSQEYKARHILLNSRDAAVAAIKALDGGADFAELASKHSVGPSKSAGGDLGWFEAGDMVPEFSAETAHLANGSYSREPVKTQFGWHVILREDSRAVTPPDFDSVRSEIEDQLRQERVAQSIKAMRDEADIEVQRLDDAQ